MLSSYYYDRLSDCERKQYHEILNGLSHRCKQIKLSSPLQQRVMESIKMVNPQLYYVNFFKCGLTEYGNRHFVTPVYLYDAVKNESLERQVDTLYKHFSPFNGELYLRKVHNYFVKNIRYDESEQARHKKTENHSAAGPFFSGKGVCEGIALAYAYLLRKKGFDCTVVTGMCEGEGHMWNVVCLNGNNYHIDVTNDITQTGSCFDKPCYFYYLITDDAMRKTVTFEERFQCTQTADNPFYLSGKVFGDDGLCRYLAVLPRDTRTVFFKYIGSKGEREVAQTVAERLLVQGGRLVSSVDKTGTIYYFTVMGG